MQYSYNTLRLLNIAFIAILGIFVVYYLRTLTLQRKAEALGKIAYIDPLAKIPNRASCDREITRHIQGPPESQVGVVMFDMNNLKLVNDRFGHQAGDTVIRVFAAILAEEARDYGFVGRYGGDEFLAIFDGATEERVLEYLRLVKARVATYNSTLVEPVKKLSYAAGYVVGRLENATIHELVNQADHNMYQQKRKMKEAGNLY